METMKYDEIWDKTTVSACVYEDSREAFFTIVDQGIIQGSFAIKSNVGNYGSLEVYEDGRWGVYTPDPTKISSIDPTKTEYDIFEYTYIDEEGNKNSGEVSIQVNYGGSIRVYSTEDSIYFDEKYLPRGTEPNFVENVKTGKIYFTEDEHLEYIVISDYGMSREEFLNMDGTHSSIYYSGGVYPYEDGKHHDYFSFEAWKSGPGEISYTARLLEATHFNSTLINGDSHTSVDVRCDFRYSDRPNDYRYIPIHIKDDVAYIKDIPICELGAPAPGIAFAYGNVTDYVVKGADARARMTPGGGELPEVTSWWVDPDLSQEAFAPYGTLTLSEDGTYYFDFNPQSEAFRAIHEGEIVNLNLPFQYKECDGEPIQGSIKINLMGTNLSIAPRPGNVPISGGDIPADNPYVPGNPDDPDRDPSSSGATGTYDPMNPNWGLDKDGNALLRVFESGLPNGSEAGQRNVTAHGCLDIDATVGLARLRIATDNGEYEFTGDNLAIPLQGGTLSLTKADADAIYYEFTLDKPVMHESGKEINSDEQSVTLIATDKFGNEERMGLEVQIIDDVPRNNRNYDEITIGPDPAPAWDTRGLFWGPSTMFLLGADYVPESSPFSIETPDGMYGSFNMKNDNDGWIFGYVLDSQKIASIPSGTTVTDTTKIVYTDSDGDSTALNVHVMLDGPGVKPRFTANEADLLNGTIIEVPGFEIIDVVNHGKYGTVMRGDDGLWRYMLAGGIDSGMVQGTNTSVGADSFILRLKGYGHETSQFFDVDIIDSVPTFTAGQDRLVYDFGADNGGGKGLSVQVQGVTRGLVPGVETIIAGKNGLLTLSPDGSCRYTPNTSTAGTDRFDFTITDSDGDRALATVEASVLNGVPQTVITIQDADSLAATQINAMGIGADAGISTGV